MHKFLSLKTNCFLTFPYLLPQKMTTGWTPLGADQNDGFSFRRGFLLFNDISGGGANGAVVRVVGLVVVLVAGWEWRW